MTELPTQLVDACRSDALMREAGAADAVGGVLPDWVVTPDSAAALGAVMAACADADLATVVRGGGSKLAWGNAPSACDVLIDVGQLAGVHHHYVDDLVVTVGAGTRLRDVQAKLSRSRQRLAIDPGSADATVGGVLATGEAGPLRYAHGTPRDLLLGVEFVRADGTLARSGGRVVKNVAGYDLGKLLCGSYGTLGVITQATFRTQPLPVAQAWVTRQVASTAEMSDAVKTVETSPIAPAAIEVDLAADVNSVLGTVAVLLEGSESGVRARTDALVGLLGDESTVSSTPPPWWGAYPFDASHIALKVVTPAAELGGAIDALWQAAGERAGERIGVRGSAGVGVCFAALPASAEQVGVIDAVRKYLAAVGGSCVALNAPDSVRPLLDMWGPVSGLALMKSVKDRFDPGHRLAPGRYVGDI